LKEGGESLPVTQENKREFVQLSAQYRLYSSIKDQIENLLTGFYEIIPKELITIVSIPPSAAGLIIQSVIL
jgi:E3 ubiquitin-protein ligase HUWE1